MADKKYSRAPLSGEENANVREVLEARERTRWFRDRLEIWSKWALAIVPVMLALYTIWQTRGGK
jgi:hypothetical protein